MIIYLSLLAAIYVLGKLLSPNKTKSNKLAYVIIIFGAILLLSCLRSPDIGIDLQILYAPHYEDFATLSWDRLQSVTISGDWELGFCIMCKLLTYISRDVQIFIVVASIISIVPYGIFIYRNCKDVVFASACFIMYNVLFATLNTVRQSIAVGIVLIGYEFLKKRRYIAFSLITLFAMTFHKSALVAFVMIFFVSLRLTRTKMIVLFVAIALVPAFYSVLFEGLLNISFLNESYDNYETSVHALGYINRNSIGQFIFPAALFLLMMIFVRPWSERTGKQPPSVLRSLFTTGEARIKRLSKAERRELDWSDSTVAIGVYLTAVFRFFVFFVFVMGRLSMYFVPFMFIAFPRIRLNIKNIYLRMVIKYALYGGMLFYFCIIGFNQGGSLYGTVDYQFFWQ